MDFGSSLPERTASVRTSTCRHASAIIAGSSQVYSEPTKYHEQALFIPELGIPRSLCCDDTRQRQHGLSLALTFVGELVHRIAGDLTICAAAMFLGENSPPLTVVGDDPERARLGKFARSLGRDGSVALTGWLSHSEVLGRMTDADVFLIPSACENVTGVILETLPLGAVPVVANFGEPGDAVRPDVGYKTPRTSQNNVTSKLRRVFLGLQHGRCLFENLWRKRVTYLRARLTRDANSQDTTKFPPRIGRRGPRADVPPPKMIAAGI